MMLVDGVSYGCVAVWRPIIYNVMTSQASQKFLVVVWAALLFRILEVSGSNFGPEKDYLWLRIFVILLSST